MEVEEESEPEEVEVEGDVERDRRFFLELARFLRAGTREEERPRERDL